MKKSTQMREDRFTWDTLDGLEFLTDEEAAEYEALLASQPVEETEGPFPKLVLGDSQILDK
jgi:succinate dehydrogenase/fumarate reductase flavoprotein subunit